MSEQGGGGFVHRTGSWVTQCQQTTTRSWCCMYSKANWTKVTGTAGVCSDRDAGVRSTQSTADGKAQ